ncbi:hypothetical protein JVT61DRAFT_8628 [Boletus reticuloceps]|uniref:Uncharacterized protein n=1 Tax=Boletus reticuloceps TaxID=495285 RepID=A0A8I3ACM1_9AGAM|nr:hypothetical protein JVT61DRAFT_8628 [Boletus reticuloceps]
MRAQTAYGYRYGAQTRAVPALPSLRHHQPFPPGQAAVYLKVEAYVLLLHIYSVPSTAGPHDSSPELEVSLPSSPESEISTSTTPEFGGSALPTFDSSPPSTPSLDNPQIVITRTCPFFSGSWEKSDSRFAGFVLKI